MNTIEIIGLVLTVLVMLIGTACSLLPGIPGTPIVLVAAVGHRLYFGPEGAQTWVLVVLSVIMLVSLLLDYLASIYGVKRMGGSWWGILGASVGAIVGMFFAFPGILVGPFAGAVLFEWLHGRRTREAMRAGVGAVLGLLGGAIGKLACCFAMIGLFIVNVLWHSTHLPIQHALLPVRHWLGA